MLGAAGCKWVSEDAYCQEIKKTSTGFSCKKYGELQICHNGEPYRAKQCQDDRDKGKNGIKYSV